MQLPGRASFKSTRPHLDHALDRQLVLLLLGLEHFLARTDALALPVRRKLLLLPLPPLLSWWGSC